MAGDKNYIQDQPEKVVGAPINEKRCKWFAEQIQNCAISVCTVSILASSIW